VERHDVDPAEENCPAEQLEHWLAPMKMVRVTLKRVLTSTAVNTVLYIRKSLIDPFK
jgi:hypothetical protein